MSFLIMDVFLTGVNVSEPVCIRQIAGAKIKINSDTYRVVKEFSYERLIFLFNVVNGSVVVGRRRLYWRSQYSRTRSSSSCPRSK